MSDDAALSVDAGRFAHLEPELVMPTQYEDLHRSNARAPELRLMAAVLGDAVRCYRHNVNGTRPRARRIFSETLAWFAAEQPEEPFSFVTICALLGIDPECFRAGLPRWPPATATRHRRAPSGSRDGGGGDPLTNAPRAPLQQSA